MLETPAFAEYDTRHFYFQRVSATLARHRSGALDGAQKVLEECLV
jgi:hypothetical protein